MAVDGTYHITINTPMGPQKATLVLETKDGTLSGSMDSAMGLATFTGGTVNGNEATWESELKTPIGMMKFENKAVVDGDKISGMAKAPMGSLKFEGTRAGSSRRFFDGISKRPGPEERERQEALPHRCPSPHADPRLREGFGDCF